MKTLIKYFVVTFLIIFISACTETSYKNIDNKQLVKMKGEGVPVIDIRRPDEWKKTGIIDGSHKLTAFNSRGQFNPNFMPTLHDIVNKEQPVILICRTGNRTSALAKFLSEKQGFTQVYNVADGITKWIKEGEPVIKVRI